ncbi:hypothetical protein ASD97_35135 [Streptomyces sp. Root63]|nr:hypothetical protein ASD97_35135 [Streptomyces sp. Root63]
MTILEPFSWACRAWPLGSGVCESHSFWTTREPTLFLTTVAGSADFPQKAQGLMLDAKSPKSG